MSKEFDQYVNEVIYKIGVSGKRKRRIREDLHSILMEKQQINGESNPYVLLGDPEEVAADFRENLEISNNLNHSFRTRYRRGREYISKRTIFGIPLVHINTKPFGVSKGIFSFGSVAIGLFSFGFISMGAISFGLLALAIFMGIGSISFSAMISIGGIAVSYMASIGGIAVAKDFAIGGYAMADIAIGGVAKGIISIFKNSGTGYYTFKMPIDPEEVIYIIKKVYPNTIKFVFDIIRNLM